MVCLKKRLPFLVKLHPLRQLRHQGSCQFRGTSVGFGIIYYHLAHIFGQGIPHRPDQKIRIPVKQAAALLSFEPEAGHNALPELHQALYFGGQLGF